MDAGRWRQHQEPWDKAALRHQAGSTSGHKVGVDGCPLVPWLPEASSEAAAWSPTPAAMDDED